MGLLEKIKLLFKVQKPVSGIITDAKEATKSKKWFHFTVLLVANLLATAGALTGVIPPTVQLIATSALQAIYNILRGLDKANSQEIKGVLRTTEFWLSAMTEAQKGLVSVETGGIAAPWVHEVTSLINLFSLTISQSLAAETPSADTGVPTEEKK